MWLNLSHASKRMNLSRRFHNQQLIFAVCSAVALFSLDAGAQDKITGRDGKVQQVKILGVQGSMVQTQGPYGAVPFPLANIAQVEMQPPADFTAGKRFLTAKDNANALVAIRGVVDKFKGLPTAWAEEATLMLGDLYIETNDLAKAEKAYEDAKRIYPASGGPQAEIGIARIAFGKKDLATAKAKLQPVTEEALGKQVIPAQVAAAYSKAFYLLGQIKEAEKDYPGALEAYLRTATLFCQDTATAKVAQERADALRKEQPSVTVP